MRWPGHVACTVEMRGVYRGKLERNRSLGSLLHKLENNIKMYLQEVGWGGRD
jgi:hypothetical protein